MRQILLTAILVFASSLHAADPGITNSEIILGAHTAESGFVAPFGVVPRAVTAFFESLNEKGGVFGRKIKFIRIDTGGDQLKAVQITKKLVEEDHIFAMLGSQGPPHQAVYKYLIEKGVPDLYFADGIQEYSEPVKKLIFPGTITWTSEGAIFGNLVAKKYKGKKACFLIGDNALGEEFLKGAQTALEENNKKSSDHDKIKVGTVEKVDRKAAQTNTEVLKLKKENCEVIITSLYARPAPASIGYASSQGFKPVWLVTAWNATEQFLELLPAESRDGVISEAMLAFSDELGSKVTGWDDYKKMMTKASLPVSAITALGYSMGELMTETLKRAGKDLTRDKLVSAAESIHDYRCSLCLAPVNMSASNHVAFNTPNLIISKGGKWVLLNEQ